MKKEEIYMKLFNFSRPTYYKWKRDGILAMKMIEENFTDEELISYIENQGKPTNQFFTKNLEDLLIEQAIYSAKMKIYSIFDSSLSGVIFNKPARDVLQDVISRIDPKDESYSIENTKQRLIDQIAIHETKFLKVNIPGPKKLLSSLLNDYFSNLEAYVMVKYKEKML